MESISNALRTATNENKKVEIYIAESYNDIAIRKENDLRYGPSEKVDPRLMITGKKTDHGVTTIWISDRRSATNPNIGRYIDDYGLSYPQAVVMFFTDLNYTQDQIAEVENVSRDAIKERKKLAIVKMTGRTFPMQKGRYVFGDPCYYLRDQIWKDFIKSSEYQIEMDGYSMVRFYLDDGTYHTNQHRSYPIDSGTIALIPVEFLEKNNIVVDQDLVDILEFPEDFVCSIAGKIYTFGDIQLRSRSD